MEGYDALGAMMGAFPGLSIFRKFGALNSRHVLFLQAQLVEKEGKLLSAIANDRDSQDEDRKSFSFNFDAMMSSEKVPPNNEDSQRELMLEIGPLLRSYCICPDFTPPHPGDKITDRIFLSQMKAFPDKSGSSHFLLSTNLTLTASGLPCIPASRKGPSCGAASISLGRRKMSTI